MTPDKKATAKGAPAAAATEIEALRHPADVTRRNIPTAETSSFMEAEEASARPVRYPRNPDLDPQLVWRGKDAQDGEDLSVPTVPIYIQEKVLPEALIRDLRRQAKLGAAPQADLFGGFDRIGESDAKLEFYAHTENWSNRMILGDSLLVMNSLAEKEGLRGQVQMIYLDPPYGIRFASNWQPSTRTRDVKEGKAEGLSREPEQVKAFRDTWKDGIHTYLAYLRDRLVVARELLAESGSIFVQIGDENVHTVRSLLDEVFHPENFIAQIAYQKTTGATSDFIGGTLDYIVWYGKRREAVKFRSLYTVKTAGEEGATKYKKVIYPDGQRRPATAGEVSGASPITDGGGLYTDSDLTSQSAGREKGEGAASWFEVQHEGRTFVPSMQARWKTNEVGMRRLQAAGRVEPARNVLRYVRKMHDFAAVAINDLWRDIGGIQSRSDPKVYVVQTSTTAIERCMLMTTDPGDLVLDPTCGSGTTALVAEQWGRRWITVDTSRVALALARTRLMAARHQAHLLRDSREGAAKEAEVTGRAAGDGPFHGDIRQGFVLERVPHVTLKSIVNNAEIDVVHEKWQPKLDAARAALNAALGTAHEDWHVPHTLPENAPAATREAHASYWRLRRDRQAEMDASIARNAEIEYLQDRPYPKRSSGTTYVRVTGPFTVESLSPHRILPADEEDEAVVDALAAESGEVRPPRRALRAKSDAAMEAGGDFVTAVLDNLAKAGVQNTKKNERLVFATLQPWPGGRWVSAEGVYEEGGKRKRAAIVIGPEYGTVGQELVREASRECRDWADAMVVCGFAFDPQVGETTMNLGRLVVLKARMSQELHAAGAYKAGGGDLFVVFGEPDIALDRTEDGCRVVRLKGVDIFDPTTGEVRSSTKVEDDVACWFVDTDHDGDSFFVRHAYFLGGKDPFEKLKGALRAEVDAAAWATLYSTESRPFPAPKSGRIAVKVINHYGDEAVRVFQDA